MSPINLLPQRERLWQRQRRWWRQRWSWTLGISLAVWASLAGVLVWRYQHWVDANAQVQAQIDAQAPLRAQHQRLLRWPLAQLPLSCDALVLTPSELEELLTSGSRMALELQRDVRWMA